MAKVDAEKTIDLMKRMKADVREVINKYATEAGALSVNSTDPHSPVLGFMQMAIANAGADYMSLCGATPLECFSITVNVTGQAMEQWVKAVMTKHGLKPKDVEAAAKIT